MSDNPTPHSDPVEVEIVGDVQLAEPVRIESEHHRWCLFNGYRWFTLGYFLLAVGTALGLFFSAQAASTAKHTADQLAAEVLHRCIVSEESRAVLRDEHVRKLVRAQQRLRDTEEFIHRPTQIPGVTQKDLERALENAKQDVEDERAIVARVQPRPCHAP